MVRKIIGANLQQVDLSGAHLQGARLSHSDMRGANLYGARMQGSFLARANLQEANLCAASLEGTTLREANLQGACFLSTDIPQTIEFEGAKWGDFTLQEERDGSSAASESYRRLKIWHTNAGMYDIAGEFFFREMTAQRKGIKWWPHPTQRKRINWWIHPRHRAWSKFVSLICGYGERPYRVILWAASVVLGLALIYFAIGSTWEWWAFWNSLYFSAVSFTALGYGTWAYTPPEAWVQGVGAAESLIGVFTIALFLITFTRKMRR